MAIYTLIALATGSFGEEALGDPGGIGKRSCNGRCHLPEGQQLLGHSMEAAGHLLEEQGLLETDLE